MVDKEISSFRTKNKGEMINFANKRDETEVEFQISRSDGSAMCL